MTEPTQQPSRPDRNALPPSGLAERGGSSRPAQARPLRMFVKSFGCQMNSYDAARMADAMAPEGYVETGTAEDADLVVLNTCHIRERAAEKI